ncbi:MAG: hypothetical protein GEV03_13805 [Streptosporangiales bacterium]|nr:hypothetical protein [Streptosporangiales bacterium]
MSCDGWVHGPFGVDAQKGMTRATRRTVLAVVHHPSAGARMADVVPLLESDPRVQVVFTVPPSIFATGGADFVRMMGGLTVPWPQATQVPFDLAVTANHGGLEELNAPVLMLQHGVGFNKYARRWLGHGAAVAHEGAGIERHRYVHNGRLVASVIVLPNEEHVYRLGEGCPEAVPAALVAGDPCYDRLLASRPARESYRRALGVSADERLVVVTSTWGPGSLWGSWVDLPERLTAELPSNYRVAVILHPMIWCWHGSRQVRAWYADCLRGGAVLLPPEEGWRAALVAADCVVGDHGSVAYYAAALGVPVVLGAFPADEVDPEGQVTRFAAITPRLSPTCPLGEQIRQAMATFDSKRYAFVRQQISSVPGDSARILRRAMYRLMKMVEPVTPPNINRDPMPRPIRHDYPAASSLACTSSACGARTSL